MQTDKKRIEYIDLAKGVCILLVVFAHIHPDLTRYSWGVFFDSFRMPLYFFLSGHFFQKIQRHTRIRHKESQQPHHSTPFLLCVCLPVRRRIMGYLSFVGIRYVDLRTILVVAFLGNHSLGNDLSQPTVMVPYGSF